MLYRFRNVFGVTFSGCPTASTDTSRPHLRKEMTHYNAREPNSHLPYFLLAVDFDRALMLIYLFLLLSILLLMNLFYLTNRTAAGAATT